MLRPHQRTRINVILGLEDDPLGKGYNVNQSLIAIGSGGLTGKGFMKGTQTKLKYVPEQDTDFIFCTIGEEGGFIGSTIILLLYMSLLLRLIVVAERQSTVFGRVYGYSVVSILFPPVYKCRNGFGHNTGNRHTVPFFVTAISPVGLPYCSHIPKNRLRTHGQLLTVKFYTVYTW